MAQPQVSFVLATHNRKEVVLDTIKQVHASGPEAGSYDIIAVDNQSTDGTANVLKSEVDRLIRLDENLGSCAKGLALDHPLGKYTVFLDDDSYPQPGTIERLIRRLDHCVTLGAAGFAIHLPDGTQESGALPGVFVGCGVGFRTDALRRVGGLDRSFFMQAEEYDLCFKLASAGWQTRIYEDLAVNHLKTATARQSDRTTYYDIRNNLRVVARYLPDEWYGIYRDDMIERYRWIAQLNDQTDAFRRGLSDARLRLEFERSLYRYYRLSDQNFERYYRLNHVERLMRSLKKAGAQRIVLVRLGKNIQAFTQAANRTGLTVLGITDDRFAALGVDYRGIGLIDTENAQSQPADAYVISDMSYVHARAAAQRFRKLVDTPVLDWFGTRIPINESALRSIPPTKTADKEELQTSVKKDVGV